MFRHGNRNRDNQNKVDNAIEAAVEERNDETDDDRNDQQQNIDDVIEVQDITVIVDIHGQRFNKYDVQTEEINDFYEIVEEASVVIVDVNDQSAIEYDVKNEDIRDNSEMIE